MGFGWELFIECIKQKSHRLFDGTRMVSICCRYPPHQGLN